MQPLFYIAVSLLCSLPFLSSALSKQCSKTQYPWPVDDPTLCCSKCPPGKFMVRRSEDSCTIQCDLCEGHKQLYRDSHNIEMSCNLCISCQKPNMEYKSPCNGTHNAVCRCKAGYRCKDQLCTQCVPIPTTTTTMVSPTTTNLTTPLGAPTQIKDTVWFLAIIALLCTGIALVIITKIKPFLRWIRSKHGYFLDEKITVPLSSENDEVSTPVQEVCGKCDQPIDV